MQRLLVSFAIIALAACGGSNNGNPDANTGADAPGGPDAQGGGSFDTAIDITGAIDVGTGTMSTLPDTKTKTYYKATLAAGDRFVISTATNATSVTDGTVTDTVVTLWDPSKTQIAQDDDAWPRESTDSALFVDVPTAGTYFITVEDCNSHSTSGCYPAASVTDFAYTLHLVHTSKLTAPELVADATQDGTTAHAQAVAYAVPSGGTAGEYGFYQLDGSLRTTTDTDVFAFTPPANASVQAGARARAEFWVQPVGTANGDGSTSNVKAWVTAANGTTILAQVDQSNYRDGDNPTNGPLSISVPVTKGQQYYLFVQNGAATSTPATDYYFVQHFAGQFYFGNFEKEGVTMTGKNDTSATAEVLATPANAQAGSFFPDGDVAATGDVDWYQVAAATGNNTADVDCTSARAGSGVIGLTATLYAADGTTSLGSIGPETATADLLKTITIPATTTKAYLKVTATSAGTTTNTGTSYRCSVFFSTI